MASLLWARESLKGSLPSQTCALTTYIRSYRLHALEVRGRFPPAPCALITLFLLLRLPLAPVDHLAEENCEHVIYKVSLVFKNNGTGVREVADSDALTSPKLLTQSIYLKANKIISIPRCHRCRSHHHHRLLAWPPAGAPTTPGSPPTYLWCYSVVPVLSQCCYSVVTVLSQCCYSVCVTHFVAPHRSVVW
jgi:hypothetical protein